MSIVEAFQNKLQENYEDFLKEWLESEPEHLVSYAEEIAGIKHMYGNGLKFEDPEEIQYLMRFKNPLKVISDHFPALNVFDNYPVAELIESIMKNENTEQEYELDPEQVPSDAGQCMAMGGMSMY
jgi:hypothetical protein